MKRENTRIAWALTGLIITLAILNSVFVESYLTFPSFSLLLLCLFVFPMTLLAFKHLLINPSREEVYTQPMFWFNMGGLLFYSVTFFIFGYYNYISTQEVWIHKLIWGVNLFMYSSYTISMYQAQRHNRTKTKNAQ